MFPSGQLPGQRKKVMPVEWAFPACRAATRSPGHDVGEPKKFRAFNELSFKLDLFPFCYLIEIVGYLLGRPLLLFLQYRGQNACYGSAQ
jgi:hypothetical protein